MNEYKVDMNALDILSLKLEFSETECFCGIGDLYDQIAEKLGYDSMQLAAYDCTKICVSQGVQDQIFAYYNYFDVPDETIGQNWLLFGPKTSLTDEGYVVEVEKNFIVESKET